MTQFSAETTRFQTIVCCFAYPWHCVESKSDEISLEILVSHQFCFVNLIHKRALLSGDTLECPQRQADRQVWIKPSPFLQLLATIHLFLSISSIRRRCKFHLLVSVPILFPQNHPLRCDVRLDSHPQFISKFHELHTLYRSNSQFTQCPFAGIHLSNGQQLFRRSRADQEK